MGFNLIELSDNKWRLEGHFGAFEGTFLQVMVYATHKVKFDTAQLELAVEEMVKGDHDLAHFGIHGGFIFSKNREESHAKAS